MNSKDSERFWSKVVVHGLFDCWEWTGKLQRDGYGQYAVRGQLLTASRVACELAHVPMSGDWPTTVGVVKVVRAWGLGRCEIDLGVEVETFADVIIQSWMGQLAPGRELEIV